MISRLLSTVGPSLRAHRLRFGAFPEHGGRQLVALLDAAKLTGRGGAGFPAGRKIATVAGENAVVIANGAEGEPLSDKDATLLTRSPHLVLDGLELTARAVDADAVYIYVPAELTASVNEALIERRTALIDKHRPVVVKAPDSFIAGEESAVVNCVESGSALPRDRVVVTAKSGVHGRPTLVNNVETLAHIALIARFGPHWFESVGDPGNPGSMLVTLSGSLAQRGVVEVPTGTTLTELVVRHGATDPTSVRAILSGGYHGRWVRAEDFGRAVASGAGIVHALGTHVCGLARTAAIVDYLAKQGAGQCGPCRIGLPRMAELLGGLAHDRTNTASLNEIHRVVELVEGRGACRHPDGTARLVRSALEVFADDIEHHRHRRCDADISHPSRGRDPLAAKAGTT